MNRRKFLGNTIAAAGGAMLSGRALAASDATQPTQIQAQLPTPRSTPRAFPTTFSGHGHGFLPGRRRVERRRQRRVHLGPLRARRGPHQRRRHRRRGLRSLSPLQAGHRAAQAAQPEELSLLDIVGAHPTKRHRPRESERPRPLQARDGCGARGRPAPFCTLYHWDLPQGLEDRGGWPNRDLAGYFADYAGILAKELGDRITVWAPFNMPWRSHITVTASASIRPTAPSFRISSRLCTR